MDKPIEEKRIKTISVAACAPGMRVASVVTNSQGSVLLPPGAVLDTNAIIRLQDFFVTSIDIFTPTAEEEEPASLSINNFKKNYKKNLEDIKSIFVALEGTNHVKIENVRGIVTNIIESDISNRDIIHTLNSVRDMDEYTYTHSLNVSILASMLAKWCGYDYDFARIICFTGVLHDVGKIRVPSNILNKPGLLTEMEFTTMKKHVTFGYEILKSNKDISDDVRFGVLLHHEKYNGKGYPLGIAGNKIHLYARIITIVDVFDAMISKRVYKSKQSPFEILNYFANQCQGELDPYFLQIFIEKMSMYYIGTKVTLNDFRQGEVVFINSRQIDRPIIKLKDAAVIDLAKEPHLDILDWD